MISTSRTSKRSVLDPGRPPRSREMLGRWGLLSGGSYSEIAEIAVLNIAASASDSAMRPPRISVLAAWTIARSTASCQTTGRSRRKTPVLLAAFDQWFQLVEHRAVTPVKFFRRESGHVEREQAVELAELPPSRSEHSLQRLHRLATLRLGTFHRLDHQCRPRTPSRRRGDRCGSESGRRWSL